MAEYKDENSKMENRNYRSDVHAERNIGGVFLVALISMISGFFLGLLFAPQTGGKFRKNLIAKIGDLIDRGKFTLVEAKVIGEEFIEKSKEKVEEVSSKIKKKKETEKQ